MGRDLLENKAKRKLRAGELTLCMAVNLMRNPDVAMVAASCGFDAIFIDLEHAPTSLDQAAAICVAALGHGVTPIVRVASQHAPDAARMLDAGAQGVMVPHVETAAEAEAIVRAFKFPPMGYRSAFGVGPAIHYRRLPQAEVNQRLNDETLLIAMLETPQAIDNAAAIAAVPGIDVVHIGALDVSNMMGIAAAYRDPRMRAAFETVARACKTHGKAMGVGGARGDFELQKYLIDLGVRYLTAGSDVSYLMAAAQAETEALRRLPL